MTIKKIPFILLFIFYCVHSFAQNDYLIKIDSLASKLDSIKKCSFKLAFPSMGNPDEKMDCFFYIDTISASVNQIIEFDLKDNGRIVHYYFDGNKLVKVRVSVIDGYENLKCSYYYKDNLFVFKNGFDSNEQYDSKSYLEEAEFYLHNKENLVLIAKEKAKTK
jgi:hypothetical protein